MKLLSLEFCNWMPFYGVQFIDLSNMKGLINIIGRYKSNSSESNMAGKTSFVEAILFLLFGHKYTRAETIDELIHKKALQNKEPMYI